jgi:two-component system KDP operon response regulator KdpE
VAKRILLVEDEEINRTLVRTILRRSPEAELRALEVVEAASLAEARGHLTGAPFDAVLVDVQLPDGSGLSLAAEVASRAAGGAAGGAADQAAGGAAGTAAVRSVIIALTGDASNERRAEAVESGCHAFLDKPYAASALRDLLMKHLYGG